jgi:hypothetical protein
MLALEYESCVVKEEASTRRKKMDTRQMDVSPEGLVRVHSVLWVPGLGRQGADLRARGSLEVSGEGKIRLP